MRFHNLRSKPESDDYGISSMTIIPDGTFTVAQAINSLGFGWFQIKLSLWTGLCWMTDSMEMTILSLLPFILDCNWNITNLQQAMLTSTVFFGMVISSVIWNKIGLKYGKKMALIISGLGFSITTTLSSRSKSFQSFLLCRLLTGTMIGCIPQSVSLYAEFIPKKQRPKCVVLLDCFWTLGSCFEIILAFVIIQTLNWRWLLIISSLPLIIFTIISPYLPESMKFLLTKDYNDIALKILYKVALDNSRTLPNGRLIIDDDEQYEPHKNLHDILKTGVRNLTLNIWFIWFTCAFCYYGLVLTSPELIRVSRYETTSCPVLETGDYIDLLWISIAEFPGIFLSIKLIEIFGSKKSLLILFAGHTISLIMLTSVTNRLLLLLTLFCGRATVAGIFQSIYITTPELFPPNLVTLVVNSSSTMARLGAVFTPFLAQFYLKSSLTSTITCYAILSLIGYLCCFKLPNNRSDSRSNHQKLEIINDLKDDQ